MRNHVRDSSLVVPPHASVGIFPTLARSIVNDASKRTIPQSTHGRRRLGEALTEQRVSASSSWVEPLRSTRRTANSSGILDNRG